MRNWIVGYLLLFWCSGLLAKTASELYQQHREQVFQIRLWDKQANNKASIGSGFVVGANRIATNYHVIADALESPERYLIQAINAQSEIIELKLADVDVVHDLAVLTSHKALPNPLTLATTAPNKGQKIYAVGNPLDLAMIIVEGTYNGYLEHARYRKLFFSGSLNPGMSGGPDLNEQGEVVGINVSTAGDQISFLVPVEFLANLLQRTPASELSQQLQQDILAEQQNFLEKLLKTAWPQTQFGPAQVPGPVGDQFRCWGNSNSQDKERRYELTQGFCSLDDNIFLSDHFETGQFTYVYKWIKNRDLNPLAFYKTYQNLYRNKLDLNNATKEDVNSFNCTSDFVQLAQQDWKISLCYRPYQKLNQLSDLALSLASVSESDQGLIIQLLVSGIPAKWHQPLIRHFLAGLSWQK